MLLLQPEVILEKLKHLPENKKREVLDFIDFLMAKVSKKRDKDIDFSKYSGIYSDKELDVLKEATTMRAEWKRNI